jgi:hypothetical protein
MSNYKVRKTKYNIGRTRQSNSGAAKDKTLCGMQSGVCIAAGWTKGRSACCLHCMPYYWGREEHLLCLI